MVDEHEYTRLIHSFYQTVCRGEASEALKYCSEDITLSWGIFKFNGKPALQQWIKELRQSFRGIEFIDKQIQIEMNKATHLFVFRIVTPMGGIGLMPAIGTYQFQRGLFQSLDISLQDGVIMAHP
ncbi:MAG: hypothetical protein JSV76_04105 [Candidatus Bathyarchaeota archaeon]|nr:MAG: hypothetical protein JSV76_04105 [Candidatus Bathyarchaeota archaeon]